MRKKKEGNKGKLVKGYFENVDGSAFDEKQIKKIIGKITEKRGAGIYALFKGKEVYYIGLSQNLGKRVSHHRDDKHSRKWDKFNFYVINTKYIKDVEALLLRIAKPRGNSQKGKFLKNANIKNKFKRIFEKELEIEKKRKKKETLRRIFGK